MLQDIIAVFAIAGIICGLGYVFLKDKLDQRYQRISECEKAHANKDKLDQVRLEISQDFHDNVHDRFNKIDQKLEELGKQLFSIAGWHND